MSLLLALQGAAEVDISGAVLEGSDSVAGDVDVVVSLSGAVLEGSDVVAGTIAVVVSVSGAVQEGSDAAAGTLDVEAAAEVDISGDVLEGSDSCDGAISLGVDVQPGIRRGKRRIIRLSDVKDRQKTADFIKEQLRIVHEDLIVKADPQQRPIPRVIVAAPAVAIPIPATTKADDDEAAIAALLASIL